MDTFSQLNEKVNTACCNQELISFLMGDASLTEKEIEILCKRKGNKISGGLSSNEIMAYLYLKLYSCNGWYRLFSHSDFIDKLGISDRDIYYILQELERVGLIKVHGEKYSHFRDIRIYHVGIKKKTRFLSLNRTYFRAGHEDYVKFGSLTAGAKSMMLYLLFMENFKPDDNNNVIEINVIKIAKYMGLKKPTIIKYIKEVNEVWPGFLIVQKQCYGASIEERLAALKDKRRRYGAVISKAEQKRFTVLENNSPGFWRYFDIWLDIHGIKERSVLARYDTETDTELDRIIKNRELLFRIINAAAHKGVSSFDILKKFNQLVSIRGFFDEEVTFYLSSVVPSNH